MKTSKTPALNAIRFLLFFLLLSSSVNSISQNTFPSSGNTGIGTTSPKYPLQINCGDFTGSTSDDYLGALYPNNGLLIRKTSGNMGASLYLHHEATGGKRWGITSAGSGNTAVGDFYITNFTDALDAICIKPDGFVGIGTTSPSDMLTVNGNIRSLTNTFLSDSRFKTNINKESSVLKTISKLNIYSYNYKQTKGYNFDNLRHYGVLAQELKSVLPELVKEDKDKVLSVNYVELIPLSIQGIKELQEEVELLKKELNELKKMLTKNSDLTIQNEADIQLFPNPSKNSLSLVVNEKSIKKIENILVADLNGKILRKIQFNKSNNQTISLSGLTNSTYVLSLSDRNNKVIQSEKFIKISD